MQMEVTLLMLIAPFTVHFAMAQAAELTLKFSGGKTEHAFRWSTPAIHYWTMPDSHRVP